MTTILLDTIIPGFWFKDGKPLGPFGCMGGHMQAQGHLQLWQRILRWGQSPQEALDAKRWSLEKDGTLSVETGFCEATRQFLSRKGHKIVEKPYSHFGGAQVIIHRDDGMYIGATDPRKDGKVGVL